MNRAKIEFIDLKAQYAALREAINARIQRVLDHGQYIMGPEVAELEERLAAFVGTRYCVACSNGTDALLIPMMALGVKPGDEVITTPFTFIATAEMIALIGAKPVFVDIDPATCNLDPQKIEAAITERTRAILPVSLYGQCADMSATNAVAARFGIPVIEDGAQSFGATHHGKRSCGLSTVGATSFFPSKPLGAYGDAGACFTDDEGLAQAMREIRVHGQAQRYRHVRLGINGRLDTIQAAILLAKCEVLEDEVRRRVEIGNRYSQLLEGIVQTPVIAPGNVSVYGQYTIQVEDRDRMLAHLKAANVPTAVHYPIPLHRQPVFSEEMANVGPFPHAEHAAARVLSLPMGPYLQREHQDYIVDSVRKGLLT